MEERSCFECLKSVLLTDDEETPVYCLEAKTRIPKVEAEKNHRCCSTSD